MSRPRCFLLQETQGPTHLSHFHHYVSAYCTSSEMVDDLEERLRSARAEAASTLQSIIVEQDCLEYIFVVHPSGTLQLYRSVGAYKMVWKDVNTDEEVNPPTSDKENTP